MANKNNVKQVSFHSGFRFDPKLNMIGKTFKQKKLISEDMAYKIFIRSTLILSKYAKKHNVCLLIENNVINKHNMSNFKENPLLLCSPKAMIFFFNKMPSNVNLLLDVGHLKVSSNTLGFNLMNGYKLIKRYIKGYHLNENDGVNDLNLPFSENSWFVKILKKNLNYYSIEVDKKYLNNYTKMIKIIKKNIN